MIEIHNQNITNREIDMRSRKIFEDFSEVLSLNADFNLYATTFKIIYDQIGLELKQDIDPLFIF